MNDDIEPEEDEVFHHNNQKQLRSTQGSVPNVMPTSQSPVRQVKPFLKQHTTIGIEPAGVEGDDESLQMRFECSVCLGVYGETGESAPRSLTCGHTFCTGCLNGLVKGLVIRCPKCHHPTQIPSHGVDSLVKNYGVLEIMFSHPSMYKTRFSNKITDTQEMKGKEDLSLVPICSEHGDQLSSFCTKDNILVCSSCLVYGDHKQHPCKLVKEAALECHRTIAHLVPDVEEKSSEMQSAIKEIHKMKERVQESSHSLSDLIDKHFNDLIRVLDCRRKELKLEVFHRSQLRVEALMNHVESLEKATASAQDCHTECTELLAANDHKLLLGYREAEKNILSVFTNPPSVIPVALDDLKVEFPKDTVEELQGQFHGHGIVRSNVGVVEHLCCEPFHDGFRLFWQGHNYVDSEGCSYALQMSTESNMEFTNIYRGGNTKYTYKSDTLKDDEVYSFRVRVQTCEGIGNWCVPVKCKRAPPGWHWNEKWRNVKIELDSSRLEVWSCHSSGKYWTSVACDTVLQRGQHYMEIEIKDLAKHHIRKSWYTKLALGLIQCNEISADTVLWQDGKNPIGRFPLSSSHTHNSWAYIPTSGHKVSTLLPNEEEYGGIPTLQVSDRIGMLVDLHTHEGSVSFFCNGQDLGVAFKNLQPPLIPVLSVCDQFYIHLRFPAPPYLKRNPKLTLLLSNSSHQ